MIINVSVYLSKFALRYANQLENKEEREIDLEVAIGEN